MTTSMHLKSEIGSLISSGYSSNEIKKRIPDFPINPDEEYFLKLGYSLSTARSYKSKLKKNNKKNNLSSEETNFLISSHANANNIILDTSSLEYDEAIQVITKSRKVTILYATIKEFDSVSQKETVSQYLKYIIREQTRLILNSNNSSKYRLVPWNWKSSEYTDDIILDYLSNTSVCERPTLLTADQNLALKAKCLGFEYILYLVANQDLVVEQQPKTINREETSKKISISSTTIREDLVNIRKYNQYALIYSVTNDHCKNILDPKELEKADYYAVVSRSKKGCVKIQKLKMVSNKKQKSDFKCYSKEDVKCLEAEFHKVILNSVTGLL